MEKSYQKKYNELKNLPKEYGVFAYMLTKQNLLNNSESRKLLRKDSANYKIIEVLIEILLELRYPSPNNNRIKANDILCFNSNYLDGLIQCNRQNIGLNNMVIAYDLSLYIYNMVLDRLFKMYENQKNDTYDRIIKESFATIDEYIERIKNKDKLFAPFIKEYTDALFDYSLYIDYGVEHDNEEYIYLDSNDSEIEIYYENDADSEEYWWLNT